MEFENLPIPVQDEILSYPLTLNDLRSLSLINKTMNSRLKSRVRILIGTRVSSQDLLPYLNLIRYDGIVNLTDRDEFGEIRYHPFQGSFIKILKELKSLNFVSFQVPDYYLWPMYVNLCFNSQIMNRISQDQMDFDYTIRNSEHEYIRFIRKKDEFTFEASEVNLGEKVLSLIPSPNYYSGPCSRSLLMTLLESPSFKGVNTFWTDIKPQDYLELNRRKIRITYQPKPSSLSPYYIFDFSLEVNRLLESVDSDLEVKIFCPIRYFQLDQVMAKFPNLEEITLVVQVGDYFSLDTIPFDKITIIQREVGGSNLINSRNKQITYIR